MNRGKVRGVVLVLALLLFILVLAGTARAGDFQSLLDSRSARLWLEGEKLGGMVIGARARLDFIYIDKRMASAISGEPQVPDWLAWHAQHFGSPETKGKALFVLRFETRKPWDFRVEDLAVGAYHPGEKDLLTRSEFVPDGPLPGGTTGTLAFVVPRKALGKGKSLSVGYGEDRVAFPVPGR
jgi:hypothetical protein